MKDKELQFEEIDVSHTLGVIVRWNGWTFDVL